LKNNYLATSLAILITKLGLGWRLILINYFGGWVAKATWAVR
jgi:hypothetical protein